MSAAAMPPRADPLCHLVGLGAAHADRQVAALLGLPPPAAPPAARRCAAASVIDEAGGDGALVLQLPLAGPVLGTLGIVLPQPGAAALGTRLLALLAADCDPSVLDSALLELGNIAACAFCDAVVLALGLGEGWRPGLPALGRGRSAALAAALTAVAEPSPIAVACALSWAAVPAQLVLVTGPEGAQRLAPRGRP